MTHSQHLKHNRNRDLNRDLNRTEKNPALRFASRLTTILPLPFLKGEGRGEGSRILCVYRRAFFAICAGLLLIPGTSLAADKKPKPAKIKISGYGLVGNFELKRILKTLELARKKPEFFDASFVEDSALILASRVKRDGYLYPK